MEGVVDIDLVINLKLREEALIAKCLGRRICSECGGNFSVTSIDLKNDNGGPSLYISPLLPPPECESKLITRTDDEEEVVKRRPQIYHKTIEPVEEFYRRRGKLLHFELPQKRKMEALMLTKSIRDIWSIKQRSLLFLSKD